MSWIRIVLEKLKIGFLLRRLHGGYCNFRYPEYNLFTALALKSGLPGSDLFTFTTGGQEVRLVPYGQHLDEHGSHISDMSSLREDFEGPTGKINWITRNRLYEGIYLSEFVVEGPIRIHYLPAAKRLDKLLRGVHRHLRLGLFGRGAQVWHAQYAWVLYQSQLGLATISGTVTQASDGGVITATEVIVAAFDSEGAFYNSVTASTSDGTYSLPNLPAGNYRIVVKVEGYATMWSGGAADYASASDVTPGTANVDFALEAQ